jgi:hypothetical protein
MSNQKFKVKVQADAGVLLSAETASKALKLDASGNVGASVTSDVELGYLSGVTSSVQTQLGTNATSISDHIADAVDAHDASAISNVAAGNLAATDVQGALNELQSDIDTRSLDSVVIKKDGSIAFTAAQSMGGFNLTNVADPSSAQHAATKAYVDNVAQGLKPKAAVRVATLIAGTLATSFENLDVIDGITLATGNRILIKNQASPAENGIYIVQASGAPVRATDFDSVSPIDEINGAYTFIQEGTQAGQGYVQTGTVTTIGTDAVTFVYFNSIAGITGGDGITVTGSDISIDHDGNGLTFVTNQLALELDGSTLTKGASGLKLNDTAVTPGSYGSATAVSVITVDQQGRLTSASATTITIPASQVSDFNEASQDAVGTIVTDSNTIDFTYNDATPSIVADVKTQMSLTSDASGIKLVNDELAPGNTKYYGTNGSGTKGFFAIPAVGSAGDIQETSFSAADNQAAPANVTGLAFANGVVRSFEAQVSIFLDATADSYEKFNLQGIQKGASWDMSVSAVGDDSGIVFSITTAGQIQYTSPLSAGFVSNTMKFRALTLSV